MRFYFWNVVKFLYELFAYMFVYINVCIKVCLCVCLDRLDVYMHISTYVYMYMYVCMYIHVCVYVCMYMYVCMYVRMYVCMYKCVYVCMYIYMYVCMHQQQQLERLRYQAKLAERQFNQVDPDNRLVASELEKRWEQALSELKQAEDSFMVTCAQKKPAPYLSEELKSMFMNIGKHLPDLWQQEKTISQPQKKAFLRSLIDKVVIHRSAPDNAQLRIVWKGGATTTIHIPMSVSSMTHLSCAKEMEHKIIELSKAGKSDAEIANVLEASGFRSPMRQTILVSTVRTIRLKHGIFRERPSSWSRQIEGFLTVSQIAKLIDVMPHWIYDRINKGVIKATLTQLPQYRRGVYVFPDTPETIDMFKKIKNKNF